MPMLLRGKPVADALSDSVRSACAHLRDRGVAPTLAIIKCGENSANAAYERGAIKRMASVGIDVQTVALPEDASREALLREIEAVNRSDAIHGALLFRPLPDHLRPFDRELCNALSPEKDVDGMTDLSAAGVYLNRDDLGFAPCTAQACLHLLDACDLSPDGKLVTVIGRSLVIGRPLSMLLLHRNATVTICHTRTPDVAALARRADVLVTAAGAAGSVDARYVHPGQVVVDVSVNWDPGRVAADGTRGALCGDAAFEQVAPIVRAITPVPGGVGAVTTSVLAHHVVQAAERASSRGV